MPTLAVTEAVKSINQAESMFGLHRATETHFFPEWTENLPQLTAAEEASLERAKNSYLYNSADGPVAESTLNLLLVSPLLYLAGFCDPPFKIRGEMTVEITAQENGTTLSGH